MYVLSISSFLCNIGKPRYRQNNTGYQISKIVKCRLIPYSEKLIPCNVGCHLLFTGVGGSQSHDDLDDAGGGPELVKS